MKLEQNPYIIKSMVVCTKTPETTKEFYADIDTSYISNLTAVNLRKFVAEALQSLVNSDFVIKISATLEYTVGDRNHMYQVIITDEGIEEFNSNPEVPAMAKK
jgi:hypothetical protein